MIETRNLDKESYIGFIDLLIKLHVYDKKDNGDVSWGQSFRSAYDSQVDGGLMDSIQKEVKDEVLTTTIRLGGTLVLFGVQKEDLFHCLNILCQSIEHPEMRVLDMEKIINWIYYCFPMDDLIDKQDLTNMRKTLDDNDKWDKYLNR